ncbi:MAG: LysR family transcriptional regulator [Chroococcidiopsidaceae cyanobacterium CP_BM_ER_R8_30]|nr:LysR family transcriptional regulator [Chroococcidiopsidaceae cyanobacterium CP_BM_ER_R8_30]
MNFSQVRAVVAVAEHGNFSEAALELQLSQPAISHAIATLEEELGVPLFSRGRHGAILTPAGERILHHAHQALQHLEMMQLEANRQKGLHGGQVRIASFWSVATHLLPKVIAKFRERHPYVSVTLIERFDYLDIEQCLREGRADIGMTYLPTSNEFEAWELLRDEYVALLPPTAILRSPQLTWEELASFPLVLLPCLPCGRILHEHIKKFAPPMDTASDIQEDSTIVSMVVQELGVAILPRLAAEPIPKDVQIYRLPVPVERIIGAAVLCDTQHVPAVFAFLETLRKFDIGSLAKFPSG